MGSVPRALVNPVSLEKCTVVCGEAKTSILDLSPLRVVVSENEAESFSAMQGNVELSFSLDGLRFIAQLVKQTSGGSDKDGSQKAQWVRFAFDKLPPSGHALLRSFLTPKRIGESLLGDWKSEGLKHFHGLNESELWSQGDGLAFFTFLNPVQPEMQFIIRISEMRGPLLVGQIRRQDYMGLSQLDGDLPLVPMTDAELYTRLSECRDILTNFRPVDPDDFALKQRLLKSLSEALYSTSRRAELSSKRSSIRPLS